MAVRFKFRSSPTFDSIDIGGQSFISIRDLKSEIVKKKHLNLSQDVDLVISDSLSGQEYKDENVQIPSGSSVIIKRVPAASTPLLRADDVSARSFVGREANHVNVVDPPAVNDGASVFDDFGVDLCPLPDENLRGIGKLQSHNSKKEDCKVPRCPEELLVRCHRLDGTHPCQSTPKDSSANEGSTLVILSKPKAAEQMKLERTCTANLAMEKSDMPLEMKCSLCRNFFEEAVMIPCCQHSFCEKCIRLALAENGKCPMCSSTKCKVEDLLPNVSLRQAIERFLQSQPLLNGSDNDLHRDAPDGESGIQVELSYAATRRRSNPILQNKLHCHGHLVGMKCKLRHGALEDSTECEGENDPQSMVRTNEEDSCTKKGDRFRVIAGGDQQNLTAPSRPKMRTCYMCGSPDHLIRDCPVAASSRTNNWSGALPGCAPPYWPGSPPNISPFPNMYGGPGMMMYNTTMPPFTSFVYPSYAPSMYSVYPAPSVNMKLGVGITAPPTGNNGMQPSQAEVLQGHEKQQRDYNQNLGRERLCHRVHSVGVQRDNMGRGMNHSDDSLARRSEGKHRSNNHSDDDAYSYGERKERIYRQDGERESDRSTSEDRHKKHHRSSRAIDERRVPYGSDLKREDIKRRRMEHDQRKSDKAYHSHSRSSMEHSNSSNGARQRREESSHRSRHPKKTSRSNDEEYHHGREKMAKYPNDDSEEHYHGHKRKRFH